jgi:hypothetical protein
MHQETIKSSLGEKPPVSRELVSHSHWRKKIELGGERENNYYS